MALPRRPYLLGLFSGTSNDWATQGEGSEERERESERTEWKSKREKEKSKEYIIRSHAHGTENLIDNMQKQHDIIEKNIIEETVRRFLVSKQQAGVQHRRLQQGMGYDWGRECCQFLPWGIQVCLMRHSEKEKGAKADVRNQTGEFLENV